MSQPPTPSRTEAARRGGIGQLAVSRKGNADGRGGAGGRGAQSVRVAAGAAIGSAAIAGALLFAGKRDGETRNDERDRAEPSREPWGPSPTD